MPYRALDPHSIRLTAKHQGVGLAPGTHLIEVMDVALALDLLQLLVAGQRARAHLLVRRNHVDARPHPLQARDQGLGP